MIWWGGQRPPLEPMTALGENAMPGHLGIEFVDCGDNWIRGRMPVDQRTQQPFQRLHGGASVALAETIASVAASFCVDRDKFAAVGMEINAAHIRPAYAGWVYATAQVWTIRIEDEAGKLVCLSRMTAAVIPLDRK
jgi:1,4-dihydroxy-2-naphthoyl-CoA hydrolase